MLLRIISARSENLQTHIPKNTIVLNVRDCTKMISG
eukprot:UN03477